MHECVQESRTAYKLKFASILPKYSFPRILTITVYVPNCIPLFYPIVLSDGLIDATCIGHNTDVVFIFHLECYTILKPLTMLTNYSLYL